MFCSIWSNNRKTSAAFSSVVTTFTILLKFEKFRDKVYIHCWWFLWHRPLIQKKVDCWNINNQISKFRTYKLIVIYYASTLLTLMSWTFDFGKKGRYFELYNFIYTHLINMVSLIRLSCKITFSKLITSNRDVNSYM